MRARAVDTGLSVEALRPQLTFQVMDRTLGLLGYVVLDQVIGGRASGGIRMSEDVTLEELANLAREMTLKFAFLNIRCGGAKAAIIASTALPPEERRHILSRFGANVGPILRSRLYSAGADLGISSEDMYYVLKGAGKNVQRRAFENWASGPYAALSVFVTAERLARHVGLGIPGCRVAIEGFGKVGTSAARFFFNAGAHIVALSNVNGAIYNREGFDISQIRNIPNTLTDIRHDQGGEVMTKEEMLALDVDLLVPCARPYTLNAENIPHLKAKMIVPGANLAASPEAEGLLHQRGIHYVPGFISNCGEVLSYFLREHGFRDDDVERAIRERFGDYVSHLLQIAQWREIFLAQLARAMAEERLEHLAEDVGEHELRDLLCEWLKTVAMMSRLPWKIRVAVRAILKAASRRRIDRLLPAYETKG